MWLKESTITVPISVVRKGSTRANLCSIVIHTGRSLLRRWCCTRKEGSEYLTAFHTALGYFIWATAKEEGTDKFTPWYIDVGVDLTALGLASYEPTRGAMNFVARHTGRGAHGAVARSASALGRIAYPAAVRTTNAALASSGTIALYGSAVTAGYAIGAVVGTGISGALFGKSGARDAMDLYSGKVSINQYFDVVGSALGTF